jgi:hypothetical protein
MSTLTTLNGAITPSKEGNFLLNLTDWGCSVTIHCLPIYSIPFSFLQELCNNFVETHTDDDGEVVTDCTWTIAVDGSQMEIGRWVKLSVSKDAKNGNFFLYNDNGEAVVWTEAKGFHDYFNSNDLTNYGKDELALRVYNDESLYNMRFEGEAFHCEIEELFEFTQEQSTRLFNKISEEQK